MTFEGFRADTQTQPAAPHESSYLQSGAESVLTCDHTYRASHKWSWMFRVWRLNRYLKDLQYSYRNVSLWSFFLLHCHLGKIRNNQKTLQSARNACLYKNVSHNKKHIYTVYWLFFFFKAKRLKMSFSVSSLVSESMFYTYRVASHVLCLYYNKSDWNRLWLVFFLLILFNATKHD